MTELPTGTVTLLFSDIEGSTRLLSKLGTDYAAALDLQQAVLRTTWAARQGHELGTEGDGFFVAFATAADAVLAAVEGQRALEESAWPAGQRVRVRMGMHTGSPTAHGDGYVGLDVHRAARISAAAYGGRCCCQAPPRRSAKDSPGSISATWANTCSKTSPAPSTWSK